MALITLSGLHTYPIKSAAGITLDQSLVTARGLMHDRRWMVCDRNGQFLTQRKFPQMALIQVSVGETLRLTIANHHIPALELPLVPTPGAMVAVDVWGDDCMACSMGDEAAQWLSDFLGVGCQLVYMPESTHRPVDHGRFDLPNSFADAYPFLLISEASLADLNGRLAQSVPMNRFRPNLVVKGCDAFAEDTWRHIKIGNIVFDVAKACSRCSVPGVEQSTGEQGKEPLKTLATYRRWDHAIWFGQNLIAQGEGIVQVGDVVEILA
ncbi:MOSC domain-containing protein [Leptothoe sp. PORK10 BA2]|uniref:MOSC domain-containing protein n=1 Tax=Leptothoe sp. PORK10 BA2 TaxID=3110254 RepID=UPI002B1F14FD|nr:MOSC N-terminal beta barrel domain-containing protein [Leptothoe sp. PORK10 BA2]MEA5462103.1 MOSC N-terminal beta barrel domain-containing protein [Leptothoe sp. PORK10 BA2]